VLPERDTHIGTPNKKESCRLQSHIFSRRGQKSPSYTCWGGGRVWGGCLEYAKAKRMTHRGLARRPKVSGRQKAKAPFQIATEIKKGATQDGQPWGASRNILNTWRRKQSSSSGCSYFSSSFRSFFHPPRTPNKIGFITHHPSSEEGGYQRGDCGTKKASGQPLEKWGKDQTDAFPKPKKKFGKLRG